MRATRTGRTGQGGRHEAHPDHPPAPAPRRGAARRGPDLGLRRRPRGELLALAGDRQGRAQVGWTREPDNLNPFVGWATTTYEIWTINYNFLFGFDGQNDGGRRSSLAAQFPTEANGGISPDGKVWTIHLRPDLKWSDGQPLTAADVAFTYNYIVKNHMANMALTTVGITGARAIDPTTVQITCSQPKADMEAIFLPILPKHVWEHVSPRAAATTYPTRRRSWAAAPSTRWPSRRAPTSRWRATRTTGARSRPSTRSSSRCTRIGHDGAGPEVGGPRRCLGIPRGPFKPLTSQAGIHTIAYNFFNWDYVDLNCSSSSASTGNPVLRDVRFRDALNYAIDRNKLCQVASTVSPRRRRRSCRPTRGRAPTTTGNRRPTRPTPSTSPRPASFSARRLRARPSGLRLYKGKPITLRLATTTDFPQGVN